MTLTHRSDMKRAHDDRLVSVSEFAMEVDDIEVTVTRRDDGSTFDVALPDGFDDSGGFTVAFFPKGVPVGDDSLRDEISHNLAASRTARSSTEL